MTQEEINQRISVEPILSFNVTFTVTSLKGTKEEVDKDDYYGCKENADGTTSLHYLTGNPDCEVDCFKVKETPKEVEALYMAAIRAKRDAYKKYDIIEVADLGK